MNDLKRKKISLVLTVFSVLCVVTAAVLLTQFGAKSYELSNNLLVLKVQDDEKEQNYGGFMLAKNDGNAEDTLTYSQFYSSFATVSINGAVKKFSDGKPVKAACVENNSSVMVQDFDGIEITQRLSFSTGNSDKADMLKIEYSAENKSGKEAQVSVRVLIDPTIADSESNVISTDEKSLENETVFNDSEVPKTWCIKDDYGNYLAYGITSDEGNMPQEFQSANWKNLYNSRAGYTTDNNQKVDDNAVALTWNNKLAADATFTCSTKYGLYSENEAVSGDYESSSQPDPEPDSSAVAGGDTSDTESSSSSTSDEQSGNSSENESSSSDGTNGADTPDTGKKAGYGFILLALLSATAAVVIRKRG